MVGKRAFGQVFKAESQPDRDLERGSLRPKFSHYQDTVDTTGADDPKAKIKEQLTQGIDRTSLEKYRKSENDLKDIKKKSVRRYYETQNERLDHWLEVDTIVRSMAEAVFESMDPDHDNDGIAEENGALQGVGEQVEALLPEEEREERARGEKHAKWAINV
jgi:hypothetical protein